MIQKITDMILPVLFFYYHISMNIYFKDHLSEEVAKKYRYRIDIPITIILIAYIALNLIDLIFFGGVRVNIIVNNNIT